ncbi:MAG: hypothetical protein AAFN30_18570, partial [Actinomycetota bacterium]
GLGVAWLGPPIVCLLKGKVGLGLCGLLSPIAATVVAGLVAVAYVVVNENGPDATGYEDLGVLLWSAIVAVLVWVTAVGAGIGASVVGAIRLAKPSSSWARRYDAARLDQARARFGP